MLSIGEVVMVEEPIVSVPVVTSASRSAESAVPVAKAEAPARFLSQVDGDDVEAEPEDFFFSSTPAVAAPTASSNGHRPGSAPVPASELGSQFGSGFGSGSGLREPELVAAAPRPQFAEMAEESYTPLPRDYATDFGAGAGSVMAVEDARTQPATAIFAEVCEL